MMIVIVTAMNRVLGNCILKASGSDKQLISAVHCDPQLYILWIFNINHSKIICLLDKHILANRS